MSLVLKEESYAVMGACFEVYKEIGSGFLESVYQECLELEFADRGLPAVSQPKLQLEYKGQILQRTAEPDFVCYDKIILEIKAVKTIADEHRAQVINYLKVTGFELGLLVNFGTPNQVQWERLVLSSSKPTESSEPIRLQ